jgi:glycosyltransferase involved in cell wall biosynthesis
MKPSISIVIPTYQRPKKLPLAVRSALAGCPKNGEIIVVDDLSDTARQALVAVSTDDRLRVIDNTQKKGAAGARNCGVANARGDIILFLDDDDELIADYPARVLAVAENPDLSFGFSHVRIVDHSANPPVTANSKRSQHLSQGYLASNIPREHKTFATGCGFWIKKEVFTAVGGIDTSQLVDEDTDLACRLYGNGYVGWFEAAAGMTVHRGYSIADGTNPHLSTDTNAVIVAVCYARTFTRNQHIFRQQKRNQWFLFRRPCAIAQGQGWMTWPNS